MKRVLFLDVDGVLHPFHGHVPARDVTTFHRDCMHRLVRIVEMTECEIVLSTTWRNFSGSRNRLMANLAEYGLKFSRWIEPDTVETGGREKMKQILAFVQSHHPSEWAVLDDEDLTERADKELIMTQLFDSRFVKTDGKIGITDDDVEKVIELLMN